MVIHAQIVPDLDGVEPRRSEHRLDADRDVMVRKFGTTAVPARLINVSSRGFMAEIDGQVEVGARIWLTIPGFPRTNAIVLWNKGDRVGGEFSQPVDPLQVLDLIGRGSNSRRD